MLLDRAVPEFESGGIVARMEVREHRNPEIGLSSPDSATLHPGYRADNLQRGAGSHRENQQ